MIIPWKTYYELNSDLPMDKVMEQYVQLVKINEDYIMASNRGISVDQLYQNDEPSCFSKILKSIDSVAAGYDTSYFLKANGDLYSSGYNDAGLGLGFTSDRETASLSLKNVKKIAHGAYSYFGLALKNDNTLWGAGYGDYGQFGNDTYDVYEGWTQIDLQGDITGSGIIIGLGCSEYYSAFLMSDGTLWVSGDDFSVGSTIPVLVSTNVKAFAAGGYHLLYVKNDDTLFGIGDSSSGQLGDGNTLGYYSYNSPYQIDTNVKAVGAGGYHSGYIKNDNTLWMMGYNPDGQLGVGDKDNRNTPVQVTTNVKFVTGGDSHTLFIKTNGDMYGMGSDSDGQLGVNNPYINQITTPTLIDSDVSSVSAGYYHTLYLKTDKTCYGVKNVNTCYGMGYNYYYQLANQVVNSAIYSSDSINWTDYGVSKLYFSVNDAIYDGKRFIAVGGKTDPVTYSDYPAIKYSADGRVWGDASLDVLTDSYLTGIAYNGTNTYVAVSWYASSPSLYTSSNGINWTSVNGTQNFRNLSYVNDKFIAVNDSGVVYYSYNGTTWTVCTVPNNDWTSTDGKIAYASGKYVMAIKSNNTSQRNLFSASFEKRSDIKEFDIRGGASYIVSTSGILIGVGASNNAKFGCNLYIAFAPIEIDSDVRSVSAGNGFVTYVKNDNTLWGIGENLSKQIANSDNVQYSSSIQIDTNVSKSFSADSTILYIKNDGTLWGRGYNADSQLGNIGYIVSQSVQIATDVKKASLGNGHMLYITTSSVLYACGFNYHGQLGTGNNNSVSTPVQIATDVADCSAGNVHSIFVKNDGSMYGMGYNYEGSLGIGTYTDKNTPTLITGQGGISASLCTGGVNSFYITGSKVYGTGPAGFGQLGTGSYNSVYNTFQLLDTSSKNVKSNGSTTFIQRTDNVIYSTGDNNYGQLGDKKIENRGLYSTNGINWSSSYLPYFSYDDIKYGNGRFVMAGEYNVGLSSTDGINWTSSYITTGSDFYCKSIIFDGSQFLASGLDIGIYKSTDGVSWTKNSSGYDYFYDKSAYGNSKYLLFISSPGENIYTPKRLTL